MSLGALLQRWWWLRGHRGTLVIAEGARIEGRLWCAGPGTVRIGAGVRLEAHTAPIELRAAQGAEIVLEEGVVVESGCSIEAVSAVRVGARSRLGAFSKVIDNNFHEAAGDHQHRPPSVPVVIEADVSIGPRAIILPGAHVGCGSRIGPATVVSRRLPPGVEAAGVPLEIRHPE